MQIKTKRDTISHLSEWLSSINQQTSVGEDVEKGEHLCTVGGNADWCMWKTVWKFLKKLKIELPYGPAIPLLAIYFKKSQILIRKGIRIPCV